MKRLGTSPRELSEAAATLRGGGVLIYPTETVYGIGCNPFNRESVLRVYEIKRREKKPMPVLCASIGDVEKVCKLDEQALTIAQLLWPGPISLILPKKPELPSEVTAGQDYVAVRVPASLIALEVMHRAGTPLLGTSANLSGAPPPASDTEIAEELTREIDVLIAAGKTRYAAPSTVVRLRDNSLEIVREGAVSAGELEKILEKAGVNIRVAKL
ncbi:MAG: L-threonylcarbamoyladenylate synthase [Aigarchaeota archaeon]|nr:L-threonylcarbamoyladenylate synthase [Candidatus Pelearchaeum maunauluense]